MTNLRRFFIIFICIFLFSGCNLVISLFESFEEQRIEISPSNVALEIPATMQFYATFYNSNYPEGKNVTSNAEWSVENPDLATINQNGYLRTLAQGTTYIYAQYNDTKGKALVTISAVAEGTPTPYPGEPTPDPPPGAPVVYDMGYTNNSQPVWSWYSGLGENGSGFYRCKLDDPDLAYDAYEVTGESFSFPYYLAEDIHYFYIQERDNEGMWSGTGTGSVIIDQRSPMVNAGKDRTTGVSIWTSPVVSDSWGIASYNWTRLSGPGYVSFSSPYTPGTSITASMDGTYTIELYVIDLAGNSTHDSFTLVVDTQAAVFYPFNGNPDDESGNSRHAANYGAALVTDRNGNPESAYDVTTGYLELTHSMHPTLIDTFTIAGWVQRYPGGASSYQCFLGKNYTVMYGIGVDYNTRKFRILIGNTTYDFIQTPDPTVPDDYTWHHFAVTFDGYSDILALYYDGNFVRSMPCTGNLNPSPVYNLGIGKDGYYSDSHEGAIDDIYIYDTVLESSAIYDIYSRP